MKIEYLNIDGINEKQKTKCVIVYNERKERWEVQSKDSFLKNIYEEMCVLNDLIVKNQKEIKDFKEKVNQKLEEQHQVLQVLNKNNLGE